MVSFRDGVAVESGGFVGSPRLVAAGGQKV
jgi:hypothetical protein